MFEEALRDDPLKIQPYHDKQVEAEAQRGTGICPRSQLVSDRAGVSRQLLGLSPEDSRSVIQFASQLLQHGSSRPWHRGWEGPWEHSCGGNRGEGEAARSGGLREEGRSRHCLLTTTG